MMNSKQVVFGLVGLISAATATNIAEYTQGGCGGPYAICSNIGPNDCCEAISGNHGAASAGFQGISGNANLYGWQATLNGGECGSLFTTNSEPAGNWCVTANPTYGQYSGLSYSYTSSKMIREPGAVCTGSVKPDTLVLGDAQAYDLTKMSEDLVKQLWNLAGSGATKETVPKHFATYQKATTAAEASTSFQHVEANHVN